jgi:aspartyl-tRNA(Asn)/glutamyl-tRNA(Gln) amidotransferase subunit A
MTSIDEFRSKAIPDGYYSDLTAELEKLNGQLNAFNGINRLLDSGYPFSVKDNICVKGVETTASSKILSGYVPPFSATVVDRMVEGGFGFLGKTNMDEFGFGTFGINSERIARNPFNSEYVAGGSSSGAAIATSLLRYHVAVSESTGGSISAPAAFCGVVGFTPTYGLLSRYGLIDYANSLDKIGIMARSASDIRYAFDVMRGQDDYDTTCVSTTPTSERKSRIVVITQLLDGCDKAVVSSFEKLLDRLRNSGYRIDYVDVDFITSAIQAYYIISMAESSTNLAKFTGFKYGYKLDRFIEPYNEFFTEARDVFGPEAKRRIILGTLVRSASVRNRYYSKALKVRTMLINKLKGLLKEAFILSPTMPILTPKVSEAKELSPVHAYAMDAMTIPPNICGFPHISFPYDYVGGMPLGAQIISDHFNDYAVMDFVSEWEKGFDYRFKYNLGAL